MYRLIEDFKTNWANESEATLKAFSMLTDESLGKTIHDDVRKLARLSWHITLTLGEMMGKAGLTVDCPHENAALPATVKEIVDTYKKASDSLVKEVETKWTDAQLTDKLPMYGENWAKGTILSILILHQAHHRGQLTVLMRFCGLKVPGIYGPVKEDWASYNMPAME